jgi:hypothetical protein
VNPRLARRRREAAEIAGQPVTHAAFVGCSNPRQEREQRDQHPLHDSVHDLQAKLDVPVKRPFISDPYARAKVSTHPAEHQMADLDLSLVKERTVLVVVYKLRVDGYP